MRKQDSFDITTQARELDQELNKDEYSSTYRKSNYYRCELIMNLLDRISKLTAREYRTRITKSIVLGRASHRPFVREDAIYEIKKEFLRELENWSLDTSVENVDTYEYKIIDKKIGKFGSEVMIASFSFIPEKLEKSLSKHKKETGCKVKERSTFSPKELQMKDGQVFYQDRIFSLGRGLSRMCKLLLANSNIYVDNKLKRKGSEVNLSKLIACGYSLKTVRPQLTKLKRKLKDNLEPLGVEVKIDGTGTKKQIMTIRYPK